MERKLKIKDAYLELIRDIAIDYDGYESVEDLKELIDELAKYAAMGLKADETSAIYCGDKENYNILMERIKKED